MPSAQKATRPLYPTYRKWRAQGMTPKEAQQRAVLFHQAFLKKRKEGKPASEAFARTKKLFDDLDLVRQVKAREHSGTLSTVEFLQGKVNEASVVRNGLQKFFDANNLGTVSASEAKLFDNAMVFELYKHPFLRPAWEQGGLAIMRRVVVEYAKARAAIPNAREHARPSASTIVRCLAGAFRTVFPQFIFRESIDAEATEALHSMNQRYFHALKPEEFARRLVRELSLSGARTIPLEEQRHALKLFLNIFWDESHNASFQRALKTELRRRYKKAGRVALSVQQRRIEESETVGKVAKKIIENLRLNMGGARIVSLYFTRKESETARAYQLLFRLAQNRNNKLFLRKQIARYLAPEIFEKTE